MYFSATERSTLLWFAAISIARARLTFGVGVIRFIDLIVCVAEHGKTATAAD